MQKVLVVPDCHHPFVNKKAWNLLIKAGIVLKPDVIVILGDFLDCFSVSDHDKDPRRVRFLDEEVEVTKAALTQLDGLGASRKIYIAGNHEYRLSRYLMRKAPELFNLVKVEDILGLKERSWKYVRYGDYVRLGRVHFTHDLGRAGRNAVHAAVTTAQASVVIGHLHRLCYVVEGDAFGKAKVAFCPGWLGDAQAADYKHRLLANVDWALGFAYGYMLPSGNIHFVPVPIVDGACVVEGNLVHG